MDQKKQTEYRQQLLKKHAELTKGFERSKSVTEESGSGSEDFVDYAVNAYTKEFLLSLSDRDRQSIQVVEEAMARLRSGEFGVCLECSAVIGEKRLNAVPWTPHCISCQEKLELETARTAHSATARFGAE